MRDTLVHTAPSQVLNDLHYHFRSIKDVSASVAPRHFGKSLACFFFGFLFIIVKGIEKKKKSSTPPPSPTSSNVYA